MGREDEQAALTGEHAGAEAASAAQRKGAYAAQGDGAPGAAQTETAACCHHKETPRSAQFQADLQRRLNRAIGQLNGVKGMLDDNRYCGDVLTQLAAAESAIRSVSGMLLQDHLETCVVEQIRRGNDEVGAEVVQRGTRFWR